MTAADRELQEKVRKLHSGTRPPRVAHFLAVRPLVGAMMVVSMTCGYLTGHKLFKDEAVQEDNCGGSAG